MKSEDGLFRIVLLLVLGAIPLHAQVIQNSNLELWFRADAGVTVDGSGTNITQWADQSANANHAIQTALVPTNQPDYVANAVNGLPAVHFAGVHDYLVASNTAVNVTSGLSMFVVARNDVRKNYNGLFKLAPTNTPFTGDGRLELYWQAGTSNSGHFVYQANGSFPQISYRGPFNSPPEVGQWYLYEVIVPASNVLTQRINGALMPVNQTFGSQLLPLATTDFAYLGVGYGGGSGGDRGSLNGYIAEFVLYDTALDSAQRNQVAGFLADKYGLSIPEPSSAALLAMAVWFLRRRSAM